MELGNGHLKHGGVPTGLQYDVLRPPLGQQSEITAPGTVSHSDKGFDELQQTSIMGDFAEGIALSHSSEQPDTARPRVRVEPIDSTRPQTVVDRYVLPPSLLEENPEIAETVHDYLRNLEFDNQGNEILGHAYTERALAVQRSIVRHAQRVGADVSNCVVGPDHFHFYSSEQYRVARGESADAQEPTGLATDPRGSTSVAALDRLSGHIIASVREGSDEDTFGNVGHETIHALSYLEVGIRVEETTDGRLINLTAARMGYGDDETGAFKALTEALTEITNMDAMKNEWPMEPELAELTDTEYEDIGYAPELIFMDGLLKNNFDYPRLALDVLQQGMYTGNRDNLNILREAIGVQNTDEGIAFMEHSIEGLATLAERLDMPDTARKIREKDTTGLLNWL